MLPCLQCFLVDAAVDTLTFSSRSVTAFRSVGVSTFLIYVRTAECYAAGSKLCTVSKLCCWFAHLFES